MRLSGILDDHEPIGFAMELDHTAPLVDADLRDSDLRHMLELEPGPGLADYLTGKASWHGLLVHPNVGNLVLLPGGAPSTALPS